MTLRIHLLVFVVFVGLVVAFTWPVMEAPSQLPAPDADPDERLYILTTQTIVANLLRQPAHLLQGRAFYPLGNSITFAEPLLTPALVMAPLRVLSGDPVVAFKSVLVLAWALSGWAMYAVAFWLTGRHPAALVAGLIFALCPARIGYYGEFQIQMAAGIPLAAYALVRFLEEQRWRYLVGLLAVVWAQAVAVVYYGVILALGLVVIAAQYVALRWAGWRVRTLLAATLGAAGLTLALAPVAWPYFVTRQELGIERSMEDAFGRSADVLTYLTTSGTWLARFIPVSYVSEAPLFVGVTALGLAALSLACLATPAPSVRGSAERWLTVAVWVSLAGMLVALAVGRPVRVGPVRSLFSAAGVAALALATARQVVEGWRRRRAGLDDRRLGPREWVAVLLVLAGFAGLLSLGPVAQVAGRPLGGGLYAWLYPWLLPLHAVRLVTRVGLLVVFAIALLAAFAMRWLTEWLPARPARAVGVVVPVLLLMESATVAVPYRVAPTGPRPVDAALRREPGDFVVLEWPANVPGSDADAMFHAVHHGKRIVNGYAGFPFGFLAELSGHLSTPTPIFPSPEGEAALRRLHPLRFLVVRLADPNLPPGHRPMWRALRRAAPSLLRFRGTFGADDLYEVVTEPEQGARLERWVSADFLRGHSTLEVRVRPTAGDPSLEQWVEVRLGVRPVGRIALAGETRARLSLGPPLYEAAPNVVTLEHRYAVRLGARDTRYRIGSTGASSPGDLRITSVGGPERGAGRIALNGVEVSPDRRGYNLVAFGPDGTVLGAVAFDTFESAGASTALAAWIGALPAHAVVAGAVRDEGSRLLTEDAVRALRALGVRGDLRGRFREAHAFVGVKGAPAGAAIEELGPRPIELRVGRSAPGLGVQLDAFALGPPAG